MNKKFRCEFCTDLSGYVLNYVGREIAGGVIKFWCWTAGKDNGTRSNKFQSDESINIIINNYKNFNFPISSRFIHITKES